MKNKILRRFYCVDCDHAWMEIVLDDILFSDCEYCQNPMPAEEI